MGSLTDFHIGAFIIGDTRVGGACHESSLAHDRDGLQLAGRQRWGEPTYQGQCQWHLHKLRQTWFVGINE